MHRYLLISFTILILILAGCSSKLQNLSHAKQALKEYYESGKYDAELRSLVSDVKEDFSDYNFTEDDLVIFDVDETSLSNYDYIKSIDFGYEYKLWNDYLLRGNAEPIKPVLELYNWFKDKNVNLIFLTGREDITHASTKKNLITAGYTGFDTLICRNEINKKFPAEEYKSIERKKLIDKGYNIIANVGDLKSDHEKGFTGKIIKLPNYIYDF